MLSKRTTIKHQSLPLYVIWKITCDRVCVCVCSFCLARRIPTNNNNSQIKEQYEGAAIEKSTAYNPDPAGVRTGNGPGAQLAETIESVCKDAEDALSPVLVTFSFHLYSARVQF
jgi:hypothetical protein